MSVTTDRRVTYLVRGRVGGKGETAIYGLHIYPWLSRVWFSESLIRIKGHRNDKIWLTIIEKFESTLNSAYQSNKNSHPRISFFKKPQVQC